MKHTEQDLAKLLLKRRQLNGRYPSMSLKQKFSFLPVVLLLVLAIILYNIDPSNPVSVFSIGLIIGGVSREWRWRKAGRMVWPFNEKLSTGILSKH